jgi:hypothetical protein
MHGGTEIGRSHPLRQSWRQNLSVIQNVASKCTCKRNRAVAVGSKSSGSDDHSIALGAPPSEEDFADAAAAAGSTEERSVAVLDATAQVLTRSAESSVVAVGSRWAEFGSGEFRSGGSRLVGSHSIDCFPMEA